MKQNNSEQALLMRTRGQLSMLSVMFVLGMAVNLIGMPDEVTGTSATATKVFLGLHGIIGLGLLVGAILTVIQASKVDPRLNKLATAGAVGVVLTFIAGVLTTSTKNNWWSYAMAIGFIVSFWIYAVLYLRTRTEARA